MRGCRLHKALCSAGLSRDHVVSLKNVRENVRAKEALLLMLVVNRREQLRPDGLSSRSRAVNSPHPRSPNIRVKFKLLVLSYHRKKPRCG